MTVIPSTQRIPWIDTMKAIGLFFVVLGHTEGIGEGLRAYIYSFHIPLFFFVAGYLLNPETLRGDFSRFWRKYCRSLLLPYLCFGVITYLVWLVAGRHFGRDLTLAVPPLKPLAGMAYGIGVDHWLRHNVALWFLPALFCLHLIYYWLYRLGQGLGLVYAILAVGLAGGLAGEVLPFRLPWSIEPACAGVLFYGAGRLLRGQAFAPRQLKGLWLGLTLAACLFIHWTGMKANGPVDMNGLVFGNLAGFYLTAFSGITFWAVVSMALPATALATAAAREAMVIFPLHALVFSLITFLAMKALHLTSDFREGSLLSAGLYTGITFAALIPAAPWIRKALPGPRGDGASECH